MWVPTPQEWTTLGGLAGCISTTVAGWRRIDRRTQKVEKATETLHPNGGSSLNDAIRRIEATTQRLDIKNDAQAELLSNLTGRFEQHLTEVESTRREWDRWRFGRSQGK